MIDHSAVRRACRAHAMTLVVVTTGAVALGAAAAGGAGGGSAFTRTVGSFVADGFFPGMELKSSGFANDVTTTVTMVTDTVLTVSDVIATDAEAGGRTLTVGMPSSFRYLNVLGSQPKQGVPYVEEKYIDGPTTQIGIGPNADIEYTPMYSLQFNVRAGVGDDTPSAYADALIALFAQGTAIALANGDIARVRRDTGPYRSQLFDGSVGYVIKPVTIPLRIRTPNVI